ncbi:ABC transporter permease [Fulvivirga kasyanovii]|uniref:DUF3526 domain-containing protein n=1 Tax=Fulvivirga kasyanovii TaxID=396812 RepID=A0ABW9RN16_9BACT|nr:DUF3526 domain-containing protein [Fulvivirga kasyanovii]MTI24769.1 DUF3526 domain-containing protein [Fulvivirga kasyanovii]
MQRGSVLLIAKHFWLNTFRSRAIFPVMGIMVFVLAYAAYSGWKSYTTHNDIRMHYQQEARKSWESNPDKHPHRMAHYGSFAFRLKHALSMFDFGLESFTGNAVFLEAHKQNTVNFSEASFSTGLLRFGEISMAMILQVILPLVIFFLGFVAVAVERENGTLKIILSQGTGWKEILIGKSLGLMGLVMLFFIPVILVMLVLLTTADGGLTADVWLRYAGIVACYLVFYVIISVITVLVSAVSSSSKDALIKLLAVWLFFFIVLPRTTQALGSYFYASPSKIEFEAAVEKELIQAGDSHNPDDPHFRHLKDSVLQAHQVSSVEQLPFNYSGFVMREGEKLSTHIYNDHLKELQQIYQKQNGITRIAAAVNPYIAIKNLSMTLSGTDFESYISFQGQAEEYRYRLAQKMNELQMELISNKKPGPDDKPHTISREHWKEFEDFKYKFTSIGTALRSEWWSIFSLVSWGVASVGGLVYLSKKVKSI